MSPHLVQHAISYAVRAHRGQRNRDGKTPYAAHPMRVLYTLRHLFGYEDETMLAAAVLHDVIEDCPVDRDALATVFGATVAEYVVLLSKDCRLSQPHRDEVYYAELAEGPWQARAIKFADAYDNLLDSASEREGPKPKRVRIAHHCLEHLVGADSRELAPAIDALETLLAEFEL